MKVNGKKHWCWTWQNNRATYITASTNRGTATIDKHFANNASERAIRNVKVKQKIFGQFKIFEAAEKFAILRSIIDTAIKNGQNVLHTLNTVADYKRN